MCATVIGLFSCHSKKPVEDVITSNIKKNKERKEKSPKNMAASYKNAMLWFPVHFVVCRLSSLIFAKCKWDVKIFPAQLQHSLTAEHNSAIWNINSKCQVLITGPQNESFCFCIDFLFCISVKKKERKENHRGIQGGILDVCVTEGSYSCSQLPATLSQHWKSLTEDQVHKEGWGKLSTRRKQILQSPGNASPQHSLCSL